MAPRGVIVIAIGDDAIPAARALARDVYGDPALTPRIDDATARVLAGGPTPADSPKLAEIAEVRRAAQASSADTVTRRLFASLGSDLGAVLVVPVTLRDGRPSARVLDVARATFAPVELQATLTPQSDGTRQIQWTGVAPILTGLLPKALAPAATAKPGPLAPTKDQPSTASAIFSSPWTWVGLGVVAVAGVIVFAVSQNQGDSSTLRLQGRVTP